MEWEPSEALVAWGNEHFGKMPVAAYGRPMTAVCNIKN